jgi:acyl-CoA thioesterase-1
MKPFLLLLLLCLPICSPGADQPPVILVVGDSLSSGYGIDTEQGWVRLLDKRLQSGSYRFRVVNLSISGETTRAAAAVLEPALPKYRPAVVIIGLGGNDGLRGISLGEMRNNLEHLVSTAREQGARVLLLGMRLPPNYGSYYAGKFHEVYQQVAAEQQVPLVPFFLARVAEDRLLMQEDNIHPNAGAQPILLDTVWPYLEPLLAPDGTPEGRGTSGVPVGSSNGESSELP